METGDLLIIRLLRPVSHDVEMVLWNSASREKGSFAAVKEVLVENGITWPEKERDRRISR